MSAASADSRVCPWRARRNPFVVRRVSERDAPGLHWFVRCLSPESRQSRFPGAAPELPDRTLRSLTEVDQHRHVALVLTVTRDGIERIVGEASYAVVDATAKADTAEFALSIADGYQGRRLAERLLAGLLDAARAGGVRRLVGDVPADNARMLRFIRRCGFAESSDGMPHGHLHVERDVERALAAPVASPCDAGAAAWGGLRRLAAAAAGLVPRPGVALRPPLQT